MIWDWLIGLLYALMMFMLVSIRIIYMIKDSLEYEKSENGVSNK